MQVKQYRVMWKIRETGKTGNGSACLKSVAEAWAKQANKNCPGIDHWVEAVKEGE